MNLFAFLPFALVLATPAMADQVTEVHLKGHKFSPATITVTANQPSMIVLFNDDATPDEFDSASLKIEKVVPGHQKGNIRVRPLAPGRYPFMGEYNAATAQGVVIAK
jgi:hypothetical protein